MGMDPATAIIGSSVIGGVGSILGGNSAASAAKSSADAQSAAAASAAKVQEDQLAYTKETNQPWQDAGLAALKTYAANPAFSFSYNDMTADPSYQFRMQQGVNALDSSAASRGKLLSGAQDKAITQFGQDTASNEYNNAYNRSLQTYNADQQPLVNQMNLGRGAAASSIASGTSAANAMSNTYSNQGNQLSNIYQNAGQAQANSYAGMATSVNQGMANYLSYNSPIAAKTIQGQ